MTKKVILDRAAFFAALRKDNSGVFSRRLSQAQVEGTEAILDSAERNGVFDIDHVAQILAQVYKETGKYMLGIKETVFESHTNKRPSDAEVIRRLDAAFGKGQLPWVKTPYWRKGWFGRGPIQITHEDNYVKMGRRLGVALATKPELALDTKIGADIAVVGMNEGLFTGKKLSDYVFPAALAAEPDKHPRRIVNGKDGTDKDVAKHHASFYQALMAGRYRVNDGNEITSVKIAAGSITAEKITASAITADKIAIGTITADQIKGAVVDKVVPTSKWDWLIKLVLKFLGARNV